MEKLMSIADFAIKREVSKQTVYNWIAQGHIDTKKVKGSIFIDYAEYKNKPKLERGRPLASTLLK